MAPINTFLERIKKQKTLYISLAVNIVFVLVVIVTAFAYREQIASSLIRKIFTRANTVSSYHLEASFNFSSFRISADFVNDVKKWKQLFMRWSYNDSNDVAHLIFNNDDVYLKLDSAQFRDFVTHEFTVPPSYATSPDFARLKTIILQNPFVAGKSYLLFTKDFLDGLTPGKQYEKDVLESNRLMNEQIVQSLRLRSFPSVQFISFAPVFKIPLRFDYATLNPILFPAVRSFVVKDQQLLKDVFNNTDLDLYINTRGEIMKMVVSTPQLSKKQIAGIFDDKPNHPQTIFWKLNDQIVNAVSKIEKQYVITFEFTNMGKPVAISPPKNSVRFQEMMASFVQPTQSRTPVIPKKMYAVNNGFVVKSTGKEVDYNFSMIHNMLYRYYSEHGVYPSSLDALAYKYFTGAVPGNPQTAQGFSYTSFEGNKGYVLCPKPDSTREYCHKKYLLNEVN